MSKTKEELDALKEEVEAVNEKLQELTPEEIAQVNGGGRGIHIGTTQVRITNNYPLLGDDE